MPTPTDTLLVRCLVLALCVALALLAALVAGLLAHTDGTSPAGATLTAGATFAGTLVLTLTVAGILVRGL